MTNIENSMELRKSGLRIASVGIISVILAFIIYSRLTIPGEHLVMLTPELKTLAIGVLAITFASMAFITYGISKIFKAEQQGPMNSNSLLYYITNAFSDNKYWKVMVIAAIAYGIFFGFLSQIFIYRNDISFSQQGIVIPSINIITCSQYSRLRTDVLCLSYRSFFNLANTPKYYFSSHSVCVGRI